MARPVAPIRQRWWITRLTIVGTIAATIMAAFVVWFVGFDVLWAVASVFALGPVGVFLASLAFQEEDAWDPPRRESPRGVRLVIATIERSLAACDRLARPTAVRRLQAFLHAERDDRLARSMIARRMRALLATELRIRGIDPAGTGGAIVALFGPESLTILQPHERTPVTSVAIATCLDTVERLDSPSL